MKQSILTPSLCAAALLGLAVSTTGCASYRGRRAAQDFQRAVSAAAETIRPSTIIVRTQPRDAKPVENAKAKADAEKLLIEHMSKVQMVKQNDGKEIKHPIVDTKDPKVKKNMAQWILSH